jgi:hypothetical protein
LLESFSVRAETCSISLWLSCATAGDLIADDAVMGIAAYISCRQYSAVGLLSAAYGSQLCVFRASADTLAVRLVVTSQLSSLAVQSL